MAQWNDATGALIMREYQTFRNLWESHSEMKRFLLFCPSRDCSEGGCLASVWLGLGNNQEISRELKQCSCSSLVARLGPRRLFMEQYRIMNHGGWFTAPQSELSAIENRKYVSSDRKIEVWVLFARLELMPFPNQSRSFASQELRDRISLVLTKPDQHINSSLLAQLFSPWIMFNILAKQ